MFKNYYFIPLDVPILEYNRDKILLFFDKNKHRMIDPISEPLNNPWNILWLWKRNAVIFEDFVSELFPNIFNVIGSLPHDYINNIALLEQVIDVKPHCDVSKEIDVELGPSSYRCMLINDEPEHTFYFREGVRWQNTLQDTEIYPKLPKSTNCFAINNYITMHGSHMPISSKSRKIMLTIWGNVHPMKHYNLLNRSVKKYKDLCLQCNLKQNQPKMAINTS